MNSQQAAEFAQALADLGNSLGSADQRKEWLAEMKALVAENDKSVRLLGAPEEIGRQLVDAERKHDAAKSVLDEAQTEAENLVTKTGAKLDQREACLNTREHELISRTAVLQSEMDTLNAESRITRQELDRRSKLADEKTAELKQQSKDLTRRVDAIDAREAEAKKALAEAERLTAGMRAVIGS